MDDNFLIYEVKSGETLSSIAQNIGITEEQLRDFHNENCEKANLPWFYSFYGTSKIIIPKNYKRPEQIWKEITQNLPPKLLQESIYQEKYFVQETFEQVGEEKMQYEYIFELNLKQEKETWLASTKKSEHITNKENPDKKTSNLGLLCMEAISPIPIIISSKGEMLEISNPKDLEKKFENKRKEIDDFYTDDISKKYLDNFQKEISFEGNLFKRVSSTLLYQLVFINLEQFWIKETFTRRIFAILNSFSVECEFLPKHEINEDGIIISLKGKIIENCTLSELLQNIREEDEENESKNLINGEVNFSYIYNSKLKKITNAEAEILLWNDEDLYIQHQLKITLNE